MHDTMFQNHFDVTFVIQLDVTAIRNSSKRSCVECVFASFNSNLSISSDMKLKVKTQDDRLFSLDLPPTLGFVSIVQLSPLLALQVSNP